MHKTLLTIVLVGSIQVLPGEINPLPPDRTMMYGEWVGFAYQGTEFYRLSIRSDRRDMLVRMHPDRSCESFPITSWDVKPGKLKLANPKDSRSEPVEVTCSTVDRNFLTVEVRGIGKEWSRLVTLYKHEDLAARLEGARQAEKEALEK